MVPTSITFCAKRARRKKKEKSSVDRQHPAVTAPTTCGTLEQVLRNWEELNEGARRVAQASTPSTRVLGSWVGVRRLFHPFLFLTAYRMIYPKILVLAGRACGPRSTQFGGRRPALHSWRCQMNGSAKMFCLFFTLATLPTSSKKSQSLSTQAGAGRNKRKSHA